jgi:hypothetical protein
MEKIVEKLDNINQSLEKILGVMEKPDHMLSQTLEIVGIVAGVLSILGVVDIIRHWVIGG